VNLLAPALAVAVAVGAYRRGALTLDGAVAAAGVGWVAFARGGVKGAVSLLAFFVSSSALTRLRERRQRSGLAQEKGGQRDSVQVLANGGWATLALLLGYEESYVAGLAAAGADTWATEIGMLANQQPRLITTWRPVEPGMSGGVTVAGLLASVGGAAVVGLAWWLGGGTREAVRLAVLTGVFGSVLDSVLGATLQAVYRCESCDAWAESQVCKACRGANRRVRGVLAVNNDSVNALATAAATALAASSPSVSRR